VIDFVRARAVPLALIAVALAVRLVAGEVVLSKDRAYFPDSELYWGYAESLARDGVFQVGGAGARRTPGYPVLIAACTQLSGAGDPAVPPSTAQIRAVLVAQAILGALIVGMVWSLARFCFSDVLALRGTAWFAALFAAFDPFAVAVGSTVLAETLFTAAMVAAIWFGMNAWNADHRSGGGWTLGAGMMAGIAVLARPSGLLLAPLGLAFVALQWRLHRSLLAVLGFALVLSPWIIRNAAVYGAFVPTTLNVGESLYDGWNPDAKGGSDMSFVDRRKQAVGPSRSPAEEMAEDAFWKREAIGWARENPGRVVELAFVKLARFWSPWPNAAEFQSRVVVVVCGLFSSLLYGSALVGAVALWRRGRWNALFVALAPVVYFMSLHAAFVSSVRYRTPGMPTFELLAGAGAAWLMNRRRGAAV
jgi:4-amino-4-deoxy-L-arabinose transferase-like glycosyltransferase